MIKKETLSEASRREKTPISEEQQKLIDFIHNISDLWRNQKTEKYDINKIHDIITRVTEIFKTEPMLVPMTAPCIIIGSDSGSFFHMRKTLTGQLERTAKMKNQWNRFVVLGNSICKSSVSLDCLCMFFTLKIIYPKQYILIRGKDEKFDESEIKEQLKKNLAKSMSEKEINDLWEHLIEAFSWMPLACYIGGRMLCVSNGISKDLKSLDDIRLIKRPLVDLRKNDLAFWLLSSYPTRVPHEKFDKDGFDEMGCFNSAAVQNCCDTLGICVIVGALRPRGPHCIDFFANRRFISICTQPCMLLGGFLSGAILNVAIDGLITVRWPATIASKKLRRAAIRLNMPERKYIDIEERDIYSVIEKK